MMICDKNTKSSREICLKRYTTAAVLQHYGSATNNVLHTHATAAYVRKELCRPLLFSFP